MTGPSAGAGPGDELKSIGDHEADSGSTANSSRTGDFTLIGDIIERKIDESVSLSHQIGTENGFPSPKMLRPPSSRHRPSRFKEDHSITNASKTDVTNKTENLGNGQDLAQNLSESEQDRHMRDIDAENLRRIAAMSSDEIAKEQQQLLQTLSPGVIEALRRRGRQKADAQSSSQNRASNNGQTNGQTNAQSDEPKSSIVTASTEPDSQGGLINSVKSDGGNERIVRMDPEEEADFLRKLHEKYYPDLPADPQKLEWMLPLGPQEGASDYSPSLRAIAPSAVRFDFRGDIIAPRSARELPVHLGLHHHADAPDAAGYTIPELAHLARSSFPAQRSLAIRTLGRVMYRVSSRAFKESQLEDVLAALLERNRVFESLAEAAADQTPHRGVRAYAAEALWLWHSGKVPDDPQRFADDVSREIMAGILESDMSANPENC